MQQYVPKRSLRSSDQDTVTVHHTSWKLKDTALLPEWATDAGSLSLWVLDLWTQWSLIIKKNPTHLSDLHLVISFFILFLFLNFYCFFVKHFVILKGAIFEWKYPLVLCIIWLWMVIWFYLHLSVQSQMKKINSIYTQSI